MKAHTGVVILSTVSSEPDRAETGNLAGKRMVLQVRGLPDDTEKEALLKKFAQTISAANGRLSRRKRGVKI